jgi:hypothetical protein
MTDGTEPVEPTRVFDPEEFLNRVRQRRDRMPMIHSSTEEIKAAYDEDLERRCRVAMRMDVEPVAPNGDTRGD